MNFLNWIKRLIVDLKIYLKLNLVYTKQEKYKNIKSIIPCNIQVGDLAVVEEKVVFSSFIKEIGNGVFIGNNTYLGYCTSIGHYSSISANVKLGLVSHPLEHASTSPLFYSKRRGLLSSDSYDETQNGFTEVGSDVLISANALVLAGVKVGNGAVIAAGAVVNNDVPPYAIVGGIPAKIIRYRFDQATIDALIKSQWWALPMEKLKLAAPYSKNPKDFLSKLKELNLIS